jgi:hypothetical protein
MPLPASKFSSESLLSLKTTAFWYIPPGSLVVVHRRFRGAYYRHHQCYDGSEDGQSTQTRNVGEPQRDCTVLYPRRLLSSYSFFPCYSPYKDLWPPHTGRFLNRFRHWVGLLWTSDWPVAKPNLHTCRRENLKYHYLVFAQSKTTGKLLSIFSTASYRT